MSNDGMNLVCAECAEVEGEELHMKGDSHYYVGTGWPDSYKDIDLLIEWLSKHRDHGNIVVEPEW